MTRRGLLQAVCAILALRKTAAASVIPVSMQQALHGLRRTAVEHRRYRVNVTVTALGIPFFRRSEVGGGYASVETGAAGGARGTALQFAAGSWPARAAGLNRFGMFREVRVEGPAGGLGTAFAGFITTSKEESLREAQGALKANVDGTPVAVAWGGSGDGAAWFHVKNVDVPLSSNWADADNMLAGLLRENESAPLKTVSAETTSTFLAVIHRAALTKGPLRSPFLHNGKRYELHTSWDAPGELEGRIHNADGVKTAEFRNYYQAGDRSGLPVRIEYHARSFLRLTFEVDASSSAPIPSLFSDEA